MNFKKNGCGLIIFLFTGHAFAFVQNAVEKVTALDTSKKTLPDSIFQNQSDGFGGAFLKTMISLVVILTIVYVLSIILKKFLNKSHSTGAIPVNIVGSKVLSPKKAIYIIDVQGKRLVIGVTDNSITKLNELEIKEEPANLNKNMEKVQVSQSFKKLFSNLISRREP